MRYVHFTRFAIFNQLQDEHLGSTGSSALLRYHDRSSRGRGISSTWSCSPLTPSSLHLGYRGCPRARTQEEVKGLSPAVIHSPVPFSQVGPVSPPRWLCWP
jgi:hypothetical protein